MLCVCFLGIESILTEAVCLYALGCAKPQRNSSATLPGQNHNLPQRHCGSCSDGYCVQQWEDNISELLSCTHTQLRMESGI